MKCLSLWQPWAHLMEIGAKQNETRSWSTSYRGTLAIHAAKKWSLDLAAMALREYFKEIYLPIMEKGGSGSYYERLARHLSFGAIIAVVDLYGCEEITSTNAPQGSERAFGDYTPGRFMWMTRNVRRLPEPIPFRGAQGLFEVPSALLAGALCS